ncbi:bifunctional phosphoglucose/phosphomannose isomerase [uncultured Pontibacter sp.]|uniref:bifunctional phosphoglucose/phosphomannose isomerase n=1 Tax=uncultured Pontibacter sp. TaxID=453356 RepID=UPI00262E0104|nr:bifunctional phosphoglucose/phosphomannose isomerase [uncultured Pontibacter sp.]
MKELTEGFIQQLRHAVEIGESATVAFSGPRYSNVVFSGMGSSGIAGNIVQAYVSDKLEVPVIVHKAYNLPYFVSHSTLFIATSFSGNTEETITNVREAMEADANIGFITSGGEMLRLAQKNNIPHIAVPGAVKHPRAGLGYTLVQQLYLLHYAGLLDDTFKTELRQSITLLEEQVGSIKVQASALASAFQGKLPVIYASDTFEAVAVRFQQQLNANAKQLAHVNKIPEMNHNEIEGWQNPEKLFGQLVVLCIKTTYDNQRVRLRMDLTKPVFTRKGQEVLEIEAVGATFLEQVFYLVHLFDWVSMYLAELNGMDPNSNKNIDYLKGEISKV